MLYTELTRKALKISFEAHKRQVDKAGIPYVYHPYEVASCMDDEYSVCVALLHDVVEDTNITLENLKNEGFPSEVTDAINVLTLKEDVLYLDYINELKTNRIARKVKIADLKHNMNISRLGTITDKQKEKQNLYREALNILS